ncbi:MAG: YecA family protein [Proteobacteria bacterium]|nr:YecA family protein [Pseudomonadota bacterium]
MSPPSRRRPPHRPPSPPAAAAPVKPLEPAEIEQLQALLDAVPSPCEPLDASSLDGYLCGVLVQPEDVPRERWLAHVTDVDGRALPAGYDVAPLQRLVLRRHAELAAAIAGRQWFDPWVFELDGESEGEPDGEPDDDEVAAVYPWVAGFATALELFPRLLEQADQALLTEPLALLYRHLEPDDLEDADELLAEIDQLEPPADLTEAVEELVRATLLLADAAQGAAPTRPAHRRGR